MLALHRVGALIEVSAPESVNGGQLENELASAGLSTPVALVGSVLHLPALDVGNQSAAQAVVDAHVPENYPTRSVEPFEFTTTDDTRGLSQALADAQADEQILTLRAGTYNITEPLQVTTSGFGVMGANIDKTVIVQQTASEHAFEVVRDTATPSNPYTRGLIIENMRIEGVGAATATGNGVDAQDTTYLLQRMLLRNLHIKGFQYGVRLNNSDNCKADALLLDRCDVGARIDGNGNSIRLNYAATTNTTAGVEVAGGTGIVLECLDSLSTPVHIAISGQSQVSLIGGNFENCSGAAFVTVSTGCHVMAQGQHFLKSGGSDVPCYQVDLQSMLTILNPKRDGFTSAPGARKLSPTAMVRVVEATNHFDTNYFPVDEYSGGVLTSYAGSDLPQRTDNFIPSAAESKRGRLMWKMVRDSVSDEDDLYAYMRDRSSGANVFTRRTLTRVIDGSGSPEGVATAPIGTLYVRNDGGVGTTLYVKESGTGSTGWSAK